MAKNSGKQFEKIIREQLLKIPNVSVDRINDNVGYSGAYNIADLIVYRKPCQYYLELKTVKGTSFPFANINPKALQDMMNIKLRVKGIGCYFLIWFIDLDKTICMQAEEVYYQYYVENRKSIGVKSFEHFEFINVNGTKKRKYYDYNLDELLNNLESEVLWLK